jgi:DNA/RNA-binding domain of Phe-tRNA-synthetase-like protein
MAMTIKITIADAVRTAAPELALGVVSAGVEVRAEDPGLRAELNEAARQAEIELAGKDLAQVPEIQALRRLYRGLGKDPARYRGASEALLRRIVQGKGLYFVNTVVDINNLVSIETRHALGAYDLDQVHGDVVFRAGAAGESYEAIGRGSLNLEGLPVFSDSLGPFGSPTSDSERTKIRLESKRIALVIIACIGRDRLEAEMNWTSDLLRRDANGVDLNASIVE